MKPWRILLSLLVLVPQAQAGVLMQGFYWDAESTWEKPWWDQLAHQSYDLAHSGFTAVWIPPVLKGASGGYSNGYDPYDDYDIGSKDQRDTYPTKWGTREQLMRAVAMMRANGLDVYFDNVMGHRSGGQGDGSFVYKNAWNGNQGGRFPKYPDYFSGWNDFGRQVNHDHPFVRSHLIDAGDWLISTLGLQGQRIDMAKNVSPGFLREYLSQKAMNGKFAVSEFWSENVDELDHYVQNSMGQRVSVFDFPLWGLLKDMSNSNGYFDLRRLVGAGYAGRNASRAVTFVENHDTERGFPTFRNKHLGYAYILTTEGYPSVYWKDYYVHGMKTLIDRLVWVHEKLAIGATLWRWADDDLLVYERRGGPGLMVGLNDNQIFERREWVQTDFGGFVSLHDYTGNGPDLRTEGDGRVEIKVPANSYVAYAPVGFSWPHWVTAQKTSQVIAGAHDLDIPPVTRREMKSVGRVWAAKGTSIDFSLYHTPQTDSESVLHLTVWDSKNSLVAEQKTPLHWHSQSGSVQVNTTGYFDFRLQIKGPETGPDGLPFWLKITYQAPQTF